jgi:hypothetical protein
VDGHFHGFRVPRSGMTTLRKREEEKSFPIRKRALLLPLSYLGVLGVLGVFAVFLSPLVALSVKIS